MRHLFPAAQRQASFVSNWYLSPRWYACFTGVLEELGSWGAVTDLENETEHLKCGFAGKPAAFVDTVQRPFVGTSFASHTYGDVVIPSSRGSAAQATRLEESHFWTAYSLLIRAYFKRTLDSACILPLHMHHMLAPQTLSRVKWKWIVNVEKQWRTATQLLRKRKKDLLPFCWAFILKTCDTQ